MPFTPQVIQHTCVFERVTSDQSPHRLYVRDVRSHALIDMQLTAEQLTQLTTIREHTLHITSLLTEDGQRLLRLDRLDAPFTLSPEDATEYVFERWGWTLAELGK